ncbi:MAG TPA: rhodanese-like domain-containing protein [Ilumatobacteraceae bacterium]|nr:rhodanese-like domain-containing protein [Ilumatobacteraceae bacterium]
MPRKRKLVALAVPLGLAVLSSCGDSSPSSASATPPATSDVAGYQLLTPAAADELLRDPPDGLVVLDVRTPEEFAAGHIAGAVDLDLQGDAFETGVAALDPRSPYFVYCHSGNRSAQAVAYLRQQGFDSIYELEGGIGAWQAAGLAVVEG